VAHIGVIEWGDVSNEAEQPLLMKGLQNGTVEVVCNEDVRINKCYDIGIGLYPQAMKTRPIV
jgi:hypothetical protein